MKAFVLSLLGGLVLSLAMVVTIYFSPIRERIYFAVDPEMGDVREKLSKYHDWLTQADFYIQEKGAAASDSLQNAQGLAWGEYKKWRTHLGLLARAHQKPSATAFGSWLYSLRYLIIPFTLCFTFFPASLFVWLSIRRKRFRSKLVLKSDLETKEQIKALSSFEDAIKKVAQLSNGTTIVNPIARHSLTKSAPVSTPSIQVSQPIPTLAMEDEELFSDENNRGQMPPTTEIERVERRKEEVLKLARKGLTSSEISRRLRLSQDQVEFIIRLRREKG